MMTKQEKKFIFTLIFCRMKKNVKCWRKLLRQNLELSILDISHFPKIHLEVIQTFQDLKRY